MSNFIKLDNLPVHDLYNEFQQLLSTGKIYWYKQPNGTYINDQICINSTVGNEDNIFLGRGSLTRDWDNSYHNETGKLIVPLREIPMKEQDFTVLCNQFKGTLFEDVCNALTTQYNVGRIRIMNSKPKTCLTWHNDDTNRIHYPIKTQQGCFMVIEEEVKHLKQNTWYLTETRKRKHTAFNSSKEERLHLVVSVLGEQ